MGAKARLHHDTIRLLTLLPACEQEPVRCLSSVVNLRDSPLYVAISYTWGTDFAEEPVEMDQKYMRPRKNCLTLLRHLRSSLEVESLWIDALCIDQSDIQERNQQVAMMGRIFRMAAKVVVWLGVETDDSALAMQVLQNAAGSGADANVVNERPVNNRSKDKIPKAVYNTEDLVSLRNLFDRVYWTRTWIIQELILATRIELHCGNSLAPWDGLTEILEGQHTDPAVWHMFNGTMLHVIVHHKIQSSSLTLAQLVVMYQKSECQDPRDKVYALLSLAVDREQLHRLEPDYNKSSTQLLEDVVLYGSQQWLDDEQPAFKRMLEEMLNVVSPYQRDFPERPKKAISFLGDLSTGRGNLAYAGKIMINGIDFALRLYHGGRPNDIRLHVASSNGELIWMAFINDQMQTPLYLQKLHSTSSTVLVSGLRCRVLSSEDKGPEESNEGFRFDFTTVRDADDFSRVLMDL